VEEHRRPRVATPRETPRDANNLISQARTWQRHNVGDTPPFGGDYAKALARSTSWSLHAERNRSVFPNRRCAARGQFLPHATLTPIPSLWGHSAGSGGNRVDNDFIDQRVRFLH
jgi:homoserine O-acetyltransferase